MNSDFNNKRECPIVSLHLIRDAIETASDEWIQYLDIETMEIVRLPEYPFAGEYDEEEQALADLIEEKWQIRFFRLPSKLDIHEYSIMEKFIWSLPEGKMQDSLENAIRGKGAFRRFKDGIYRFGIEQQWYDFQENKYRTLAIEWCENHNFAYHESSPMTAAVVSENAIKQLIECCKNKKSTAAHPGGRYCGSCLNAERYNDSCGVRSRLNCRKQKRRVQRPLFRR